MSPKTFAIIPQLGHGTFAVTSAVMLSDEYLLFSLDEDGTLVVWETLSGKQLKEYPLKKYDPIGVETLGGKVVSVICSDKRLVWSAEDIKEMKAGANKPLKVKPLDAAEKTRLKQLRSRLSDLKRPLSPLELSPRRLAEFPLKDLGVEPTAAVFQVGDFVDPGGWEGNDGLCWATIIENEGKLQIQVDNENRLKFIWDLPAGERLLHITEDFRYMVTTTQGAGPLYLWNIERPGQPLERTLYADRPEIIASCRMEGDVVSLAFRNNTVFDLQFKDGISLKKQYQWAEKIERIWRGPKYKTTVAILADQPGQLRLLREGQETVILADEIEGHTIKSLAISRDEEEQYLAISLDDETGTLLIFDTSQKEIKAKWQVKDAAALAFHPKTNFLAVFTAGGSTLKIFDWLEMDGQSEPRLLVDLLLRPAPAATAVGENPEKIDLSLALSPPPVIDFGATGKFCLVRGMNLLEVIGLMDVKAGKVDHWAYDYKQNFVPSTNSPQFFGAKDEWVLLEPPEPEKIEIWDLKNLKKIAHRKPRSRKPKPEKQFKIAGFNLLGTSAIPLHQLPVVLFVKKNEECIKLYNWETEKFIGTLFPVNEKKFLLFNDHGNYYTTSEGHDLVAFLYEAQLYPLDQFDLLFNRPHLVLSNTGIFSPELIRAFELAYIKRFHKTMGTEKWKKEDIIKRFSLFFPEGHAVHKLVELGSSISSVMDKFGLGGLLGTASISLVNTLNSISLLNLQAGAKQLLPAVKVLHKYTISGVQESPELTFDIHISNQGGLLQRLNVYVNNVPVEATVDLISLKEERLSMSGRAGLNLMERKLEEVEATVTIKLSTGLNKVEVGVDGDIGIGALRDIFYVTYDPPTPEKPDLYLVGLAVNTFTNGESLRGGPTNNLRQFASAYFGNRFYNKFQPKIKIEEEVSAETIERELKDFLKQSKEDDLVIAYYSGHGIRDKETNELYLGTTEVDFNNPKELGIHYAQLEKLVDGIPARQKLLLIDACFSGESDTDPIHFALMKNLFVDLRRGTGATIIASASSLEKAEVGGDLGDFTAFGRCLLKGLGRITDENVALTADQNRQGEITISELQDYLAEELPKMADHHPAFRMENIAKDWIIWKNTPIAEL